MPRKALPQGRTKQVTYRMPEELYNKLLKIAESMFQPMPVVLRAAAAEYAKNHRPVRHKNTGLEFRWPDVAEQVKQGALRTEPTIGPLVEPPAESELAGIDHTESGAEYVSGPDTPLTPSKEGS